MSDELADRPLTEPDPARLPLEQADLARILDVHAKALADGDDG
jgi:hypothetical protein